MGRGAARSRTGAAAVTGDAAAGVTRRTRRAGDCARLVFEQPRRNDGLAHADEEVRHHPTQGGPGEQGNGRNDVIPTREFGPGRPVELTCVARIHQQRAPSPAGELSHRLRRCDGVKYRVISTCGTHTNWTMLSDRSHMRNFGCTKTPGSLCVGFSGEGWTNPGCPFLHIHIRSNPGGSRVREAHSRAVPSGTGPMIRLRTSTNPTLTDGPSPSAQGPIPRRGREPTHLPGRSVVANQV